MADPGSCTSTKHTRASAYTCVRSRTPFTLVHPPFRTSHARVYICVRVRTRIHVALIHGASPTRTDPRRTCGLHTRRRRWKCLYVRHGDTAARQNEISVGR